jgi:hypothetical protein
LDIEEDDWYDDMRINYRRKGLIDLEDNRNYYSKYERIFFEECMNEFKLETIYIGKQRKKKKKHEKFIIYNQKKSINLRKIKQNNKLSEVLKSGTDGVILPLFGDNCCAKNEPEGMTVNYEAPMNIQFDVKEKWRTKFKNKFKNDEQLPNDKFMELKEEERLEVIGDISQQSTDDVILPLFSDNYSAKNESEGIVLYDEAYQRSLFVEKKKGREKEVILQFLIRHLPLNEELEQFYLEILGSIENLYTNLFKLFNYLFNMSFPKTQGSSFAILFLILLVMLFQRRNYLFIIQQTKQIDMAAGVCLNDQVATGVQFDIGFEKAIETEDVVFSYHDKSWHGTQCSLFSLKFLKQNSFFILSSASFTSQKLRTCTDCMAWLKHVESHSPMCSTLMSKFQEGSDHFIAPVEYLVSSASPLEVKL